MNPGSRPGAPSGAANPTGCRVAHSWIRSLQPAALPRLGEQGRRRNVPARERDSACFHGGLPASTRRTVPVRRVLRRGSKGGRPGGLARRRGPGPRSGKAASSQIVSRSPTPRPVPCPGAGVEDEGLVDPLFRGADGASEGTGELVFAVMMAGTTAGGVCAGPSFEWQPLLWPGTAGGRRPGGRRAAPWRPGGRPPRARGPAGRGSCGRRRLPSPASARPGPGYPHGGGLACAAKHLPGHPEPHGKAFTLVVDETGDVWFTVCPEPGALCRPSAILKWLLDCCGHQRNT